MAHRRHYVTSTGQVFKQESVVRECAGVSVCENDHGMCAQGDGRILATVGSDLWRRDTLEVCKIIPNPRGGIRRRLAVSRKSGGIPESHCQFTSRACRMI